MSFPCSLTVSPSSLSSRAQSDAPVPAHIVPVPVGRGRRGETFNRFTHANPRNTVFQSTMGRRTLARADDNFDGQADVTWRYTNGVLSSMERDTDFNGTPDSTTTFLHDLPSQTDWRPNGTNIVTHRLFFRYGVLSEEWWDTNMDGSFDQTNHYDAFEKPIGTNVFNLLSRPSR